MRRVALYGIGWLAAATAAVLLAWQGVGRVGTNVTDRHAAPLTAEQARQQLERTIATADGAEPVGGSEPGTPATTAPPGCGGDGGGRPGTTSPSTTTATSPRAVTTTSTAPRPATPSPATPTTPPTSSTTVTRTYNLVGGSATLRFSPSGVTVLLADPNPGFSADVDDTGDGRVRVRFENDSHRSQVEAWWDGTPRDEVREEGDNGGSGGSGRG